MPSRKGPKGHGKGTRPARNGRQGSKFALFSYSVAAAAWMVLIFSLSNISHIEQPAGLGGIQDVDKPEHMGQYFVLAALIFMALREHGLMNVPRWARTDGPRTAAFLAFIISTVYAFTDELHQAWVPERTMDPVDLLMDAIGSILAPLLLMVLLAMRRQDDVG